MPKPPTVIRPSGFRVPASHRSEETCGVKQSESQNPDQAEIVNSRFCDFARFAPCAQKDVRDG